MSEDELSGGEESGSDLPETKPEPTGGESKGETGEASESRLEQASDEVLDFLEGLLDAMELEGEVQMAVTPPAEMVVSLSGEQSALLIGRKGKTLDALQDLVRAVVQRQLGPGLKVSLDVEGYRERRRIAIEELTSEMIQEALESGEVELEPMSSYERKLVHDIVALNEEVTSFSEGRDPDRRVVIRSTG